MNRIYTLRSAATVLIISLTLSSCAVLSDSQVKNINAFAATAGSYSSFPSAVLRQRADFHLHSELVVASGLFDPDAIDHRVDAARKSYNSAVQLSSKFDLSLQLIQQYAGLLTKTQQRSLPHRPECSHYLPGGRTSPAWCRSTMPR